MRPHSQSFIWRILSKVSTEKWQFAGRNQPGLQYEMLDSDNSEQITTNEYKKVCHRMLIDQKREVNVVFLECY